MPGEEYARASQSDFPYFDVLHNIFYEKRTFLFRDSTYLLFQNIMKRYFGSFLQCFLKVLIPNTIQRKQWDNLNLIPRYRYFEKTGCLITADGSDNAKINPEAIKRITCPITSVGWSWDIRDWMSPIKFNW